MSKARNKVMQSSLAAFLLLGPVVGSLPHQVAAAEVNLLDAATDADAVAADTAALTLSYVSGDAFDINAVTQSLKLATTGASGSTIVWETDNPTYIQMLGKYGQNGHVSRPTTQDQVVHLTATITKNAVSDTRIFDVTVKAANYTGVRQYGWARSGNSNHFSYASDIAFDSQGNMYVADVTYDWPAATTAIKRYDTVGNFTNVYDFADEADVPKDKAFKMITVIGNTLYGVYSVADDPNEEFSTYRYFADKYDLTGTVEDPDLNPVLVETIELGVEEGEETMPFSVAADETGSLYVNYGGVTVKRFVPDATDGNKLKMDADFNYNGSDYLDGSTLSHANEITVNDGKLYITSDNGYFLVCDTATGLTDGTLTVAINGALPTVAPYKMPVVSSDANFIYLMENGWVYKFTKAGELESKTVSNTSLSNNAPVVLALDTEHLDGVFTDDFSHATFNKLSTAPISDDSAVAYDKSNVSIGYRTDDSPFGYRDDSGFDGGVRHDISLPTSGVDGSTITWTSSDPTIIDVNGKVTRPLPSQGDASVSMTATITKGSEAPVTRSFFISVPMRTIEEMGPADAPTAMLSQGTHAGTTKLSGVDDTMKYSVNDGAYQAIPEGVTSIDNIEVKAGDTINVFVDATVDYQASDVQTLTVSLENIKPAGAPSATLSPGSTAGTTKLSGVDATMQYSVENGEYQVVPEDVTSIDIPVSAGDTIKVYVPATGDQPASPEQTLTVTLADIKAAAAPTTGELQQGTGSGTTKLTGVSADMEYRVGNSGTYTKIADTSVDIAVNAGDHIFVRIAAANGQPASDAQDLVVVLANIKPAAAPTATLAVGSSKGYTKLNGVSSTMEYSLNGGAYTAITGSSVLIKVAVDDEIKVRVKATASKPASDDQVIVVTQDKIQQSDPAPSTGGGGGGAIDGDQKESLPAGDATTTRTTLSDGTIKDDAVLSAEDAAKALTAGKKSVEITMTDDKKDISSQSVTLPSDAVKKLADANVDVDIHTTKVQVQIPSASLNSTNEDVKFTINPVKDTAGFESNAAKQAVVQVVADGKDVKVIGKPVEIATNLEGQPVTLVLPLGNLGSEDLKDLAIYIAHGDGTKELVQGTVVQYDESGQKGLSFTVTKFSTFSIVKIPGADNYFAGAAEGSVQKAYVHGYEDGTFRPNAQITRAEVATVIAQIAKVEANGADIAYSDVTAGYWAKNAISTVTKMGLMKGYSDGTFHGSQIITRAEMASIIAKLLGAADASAASSFKDIATSWARASIEQVYAKGIIKGYEDGTFRPQNSLTRAEAVTMINHFLGRAKATGVSTPTWSDVSASFWAFGEIESASKDQPNKA